MAMDGAHLGNPALKTQNVSFSQEQPFPEIIRRFLFRCVGLFGGFFRGFFRGGGGYFKKEARKILKTIHNFKKIF